MKYPYEEAMEQALQVKAALAPHCERIEIAGSIRRKKLMVGDIEIVAIPKPYEVGLFASGIVPVVNQWDKVKGELPCKYTQRILPSGIKLDLFFATPDNWGYILAIRTGPADYSAQVLAAGWVKRGYKGQGGMLWNGSNPVPVREEQDLFNLLALPWAEPENRVI